MASMTSRERVMAAFEHREPDRTPIFEYCLDSQAVTTLALGRRSTHLHWDEAVAKLGWRGAVEQLACDRLDLATCFGHDLIYLPPNPPPPQAYTPPSAPLPPPIDDPVENLRRRNEQCQAATPSVNLQALLVYEIILAEMRRRDIDLPLFVPAYAHGIWTDVDLMQTMLLDPEVAHEHFRLATRNIAPLVDYYLGLGITLIGIGGDFAGNRPLISPTAYREFIMPELARLADRIHRNGAFAINASDGNLWDVLDSFLLGTRVDGYAEIDLHAGMDLARLKAGYGSRITFLGNLDCGNTLSFATPAAIRMATIRCIEEGRGQGGHLLTASNAITDSVPPVNYMALVAAYREYWNLPQLTLA